MIRDEDQLIPARYICQFFKLCGIYVYDYAMPQQAGNSDFPDCFGFDCVILVTHQNNAKATLKTYSNQSIVEFPVPTDANLSDEVSTPMRCIAPIEVVSKTERSSEKYLQELPVKGFVLEAVPLSSFEHKANEPYADRANKGLFTKPPIHWQMMPKEYFGLRFAFKARA